jgi:hypothetical protein
MQPQLVDPPMGPTDEIKLLQHRLLHVYGTNSQAAQFGVTESGIFDPPTSNALKAIQNFLVSSEGFKIDSKDIGVLTYATKVRLKVIIVPERHILLSCHGMGQPDPFGIGYPADIARAVDQRYWIWNPVGNWEAAAFPMKTSVDHLIAELYRLLTVVYPWQTWGCDVYSEGSVGMMMFLLKCRDGEWKNSGIYERFIGGTAIGNPMRENGHTFPGSTPAAGEGMVTPTMTNTHPELWDFVSVKEMDNSHGDDVYAAAGARINAEALANQRLIWALVWSVTIKSSFGLLAKVWKLLTSQPNWTGDIALVEATLNFMGFAFKGLTPHTSYQFLTPIKGDPRTAFDLAIWHLNDLGARAKPAKRPAA